MQPGHHEPRTAQPFRIASAMPTYHKTMKERYDDC
jgi:hypothetical protein